MGIQAKEGLYTGSVASYEQDLRRQSREIGTTWRGLEQRVPGLDVSNLVEQVAGRANTVLVKGLLADGQAIRVSEESLRQAKSLGDIPLQEAAFMSWAMAKVGSLTGVNVENAEFTDSLPAGVAGRYHPGSKKIELRSDLQGDREACLHVMLHEAIHGAHRANGGVGEDTDLEEGLVERMAMFLMIESGFRGKLMAYPNQVADVESTIRSAGGSVRSVCSEFMEGKQFADALN